MLKNLNFGDHNFFSNFLEDLQDENHLLIQFFIVDIFKVQCVDSHKILKFNFSEEMTWVAHQITL